MNFNQIKFGKPVTYLDGVVNYLKGAMIWGFRSKYKWSQTTPDIWGFANPTDIDPEAQAVYDRIIADGGVSNLTRLNYFVVGLKTIYGTLANVPVCYDAHWIGYKLGSGTGATSGQAVAKLYSLTVAGDAVQATAASQPLLLAHNGASTDNYWCGSSDIGNYVSTPNSAANSIVGEIEIICSVNSKGWNTTQYDVWVAKYNGTNYQYQFYKDGSTTNNNLVFAWTDATGVKVATSSAGLIVSSIIWVRVTKSGAGINRTIKFYYSNQSKDTNINSITWIQLGTDIIVAALDAVSVNTPTTIGRSDTGTVCRIIVYRATISNSIGGAPVVDFNPATYNASTSQTQWTSSTGEVWTINIGTATTGYKGVLVDRSIVMYDRTDDNLLASNNATLNTVLGTDHCSVLVATRYSSTNNEFIMEVGGDYTDINSTQWWLSGGLLNFTRTNKGLTLANSNTTNNYVLAKAFSYADSIIFGGTSIQLVNASSNSGSYYNNTTNKPIPNTGLLLGKSAGIGNFNGIISTIIIGNDPTKYLLTKELARSLNNNFAL